jgi:hypothetical protein
LTSCSLARSVAGPAIIELVGKGENWEVKHKPSKHHGEHHGKKDHWH